MLHVNLVITLCGHIPHKLIKNGRKSEAHHLVGEVLVVDRREASEVGGCNAGSISDYSLIIIVM